MDPPLRPFMDELSVGSSSDESFEHPYTPADVSCYYLDLQQMDVRNLNINQSSILVISKFNPLFELPPAVTATPAVLLELFLPDHLVDEWVKCTNEYAASKLVPTRRKTIT